MFSLIQLEYAENLFGKLYAAQKLEQFSKGRLGAILVRPENEGEIPIVRTTAVYKEPGQPFTELHDDLAEELGFEVNNCMVEVYDSRYRKMSWHSDGALDLDEGSSICLVSFYEDADEPNPRLLVVKDKATGEEQEYTLHHNSAIVFSVGTNRRFVHKIVSERLCVSRWLGLTFRKSKTFVRAVDGAFCFRDKSALRNATDEERKQFYCYKGRENSESDYTYPDNIDYTLSEH